MLWVQLLRKYKRDQNKKTHATLASHKKAVSLSVRPSVKRVACDKIKESSASIFIQYDRTFILVLPTWRMVGGGDPFYLKFSIGSSWPSWSENADFQSIFAHSTSAATPSEKVQLILIGSPLRAFQWAQDEYRTLPLSPKGDQQRKVSKIWTINCDNFETVLDRMSVSISH